MAKATSDKSKKATKKISSAARPARAASAVKSPVVTPKAKKSAVAAPLKKAIVKSGADKSAAVKNGSAKVPRKSALAKDATEKSGVKKAAVKPTKKKTVVAKPPTEKSTKKATPLASVAPSKSAAKKSPAKVTPPTATSPLATPSPKTSEKKAAAPAVKKPKEAPAAENGALAVGSKAPSFTLADQSGKTIASASLAGKPYVLYFYPKDNTPGCTQEACDFRDGIGAFQKVGVPVFGVSPDSVKSHAGFAQKFSLPFSLLADVDKQLVNAYGVWALKQNYGREYWGVVRSTFLIDRAGKVARVWSPVRVKDHAQAVREAAAAL